MICFGFLIDLGLGNARALQLAFENVDFYRAHVDEALFYRRDSYNDGREIVSDGRLVVPPLGSNQRRYAGVLGTRRLNLGNGYALHGTNRPETIGRSVSHGCIRLRNEDIEKLFDMVDVGTPVYVY